MGTEAYLVHGTARAVLLWGLAPILAVAFFLCCVSLGRALVLAHLDGHDE